jgi:hypothetical protein
VISPSLPRLRVREWAKPLAISGGGAYLCGAGREPALSFSRMNV